MKKSWIVIVIIVVLLIIALFFILRYPAASNQNNPQTAAQVSGISDNEADSVVQDVTSVNDSDFDDSSLNDLG